MRSVFIFFLFSLAFYAHAENSGIDPKLYNYTSRTSDSSDIVLKYYSNTSANINCSFSSGWNIYSVWKNKKSRDVISKSSASCKKNFLQQAADELKDMPNNYNCNILDKDENCRHYHKHYMPYINWIQNLNDELLAQQTYNKVPYCFATKNSLTELIRSTEESLESYYCSDLSKGESRLFSPNNFQNSRVSIDGAPYKITKNKENDNELHIKLPVKFVFSENFYSSNADNAKENFIPLAQKCLDTYSSNFINKDKKIIKINLVDTVEGIATTPISIENFGVRSNSEAWSTNARCPTLIHEILHLIGLSDEYPETEQTKAVKYIWNKIEKKYVYLYDSSNKDNKDLDYSKSALAGNCRLVRENNIMNSHEDYFADVVSNGKFKTIKEAREKAGPSFWKDGQYTLDPKIKNKLSKSFLTEDQWNSIAYRGCIKKNKTYNLCTSFAYKTSVTEDNGKCPAAPKVCIENGWRRPVTK